MNAADDFALEHGSGADAPGRRLARAREAHNLTQHDIARRLKLSVGQVEALEADDYERLPGPTFVRGFIRNYARLLCLDPEELARAAAAPSVPEPLAGAEMHGAPAPLPVTGARSRRWPLWGVLGAAAVAGLALYEFYPLPEPTPAPGGRVSQSREISIEPPLAAAGLGVTQADAVVTAKAGSAAERPGVADPPRAVSAPTSASRRPGEKRVKLVFEEESWVEIRDRNENVIFSRLNPAGSERQVSGLPPFSVTVGNASSVRLTYDDVPVDLAPHTRTDVARLILR